MASVEDISERTRNSLEPQEQAMTDTQTSGPLSQSVERLRREFERWLDAAMHQGNRALDVVGLRGADRPWTPAVDLLETPTEVHIDVDLPGIDPVLVEVALTGNMLTVQGPKRTYIPPQGGTVHLSERMQGPFHRSIPMPAPVIADSVSAELKNGVLQIRLMKSERARAMKIPVHAEPVPVRQPASPVPAVPAL
jgi:HSP20 family protein